MPGFLRSLFGGGELPQVPQSELSIVQIAETKQALADERLNLETYQAAEVEAKSAYDAAKKTSDEGWRKSEWVKCMNAVDQSKKLIATYEKSLEMYEELAKRQKKKK